MIIFQVLFIFLFLYILFSCYYCMIMFCRGRDYGYGYNVKSCYSPNHHGHGVPLSRGCSGTWPCPWSYDRSCF